MPAIEITEDECKKAAVLDFGGASVSAIAKELRTTTSIVKNKILTDERFHAAKSALVDSAHLQVADMYKRHLADLLVLAIARLKEELEPGSRAGMDAVKTVFKSAGIIDGDNQSKAETSFQIIMPNTETKEIIIPKDSE